VRYASEIAQRAGKRNHITKGAVLSRVPGELCAGHLDGASRERGGQKGGRQAAAGLPVTLRSECSGIYHCMRFWISSPAHLRALPERR
jgi:hypothetical protein